MIGDGGFNTKAAMELVRRHNLSAAIFAPAWTYQKFKPEERMDADLKFWLNISPFLYPCNQRFSKLPIRFNHFKRTFFLREDINVNSAERSSKSFSEVEVPCRYLTNLGCQTALPLLLPTSGANYSAIKCVDSIIYSRQFNDSSNELSEVSVPLYMLSINLLPSQVVSVEAHFAIAACDVEFNDTSPLRYSVGVKYKILKPLQDGLIDEGEYQLEVPFMPELVGVKCLGLRDLAERYLNLSIASRSICKIDANWAIHNREVLKGCEKLRTLKLALTIEANKEAFSHVNFGSEKASYEIREIYIKINGPDQGIGHFMFALNYFEMKLHISPQTELGISNHLNTEFWDLFVREYEFCEGSPLKLHLSWVATNSPTRRIYNVSFTKDKGILKCLTDAPNMDKLECAEEKDNSYQDCQHFAIFKQILYKNGHQAEEEKDIAAGDWSFVGITSNYSYYFSHTFNLPRASEVFVPSSMIILLHPLHNQTRSDLDDLLRELVVVAHSPIIKFLLTND